MSVTFLDEKENNVPKQQFIGNNHKKINFGNSHNSYNSIPQNVEYSNSIHPIYFKDNKTEMSHTSEGPPTKSFLNSQIQNNTEYQISAKSQQNPNYYQPNYTQNYNVNYPPNNYYPINFQQSYTNPFNPQPHFNTDSSTPQVTFSQQPLNLLSKGQSAQINQTKANEPETQKGIEVTNSLDHVSAAYIANKQLKRWGWKTSEYKTVPKEKDTMQSVFRSVQTSKASSGQYNEDMEEPENENELDGIEEEIKLSPIKRLLSIWDKLYS